MKKVTEIPATIFPKIKDTKAKLNVAAYFGKWNFEE